MRNNHIIRTYSELILLPTFEQRYEYLRLSGSIGVVTFGFDRYLNQRFYNSMEWRNLRREIIIRDGGCDLAIEGREIEDGIRIHHLNAITIEDFEAGNYDILDPEFLICCSLITHNAIHFGNKSNLIQMPQERRKGDTRLW
jgi:hypothetical protein